MFKIVIYNSLLFQHKKVKHNFFWTFDNSLLYTVKTMHTLHNYVGRCVRDISINYYFCRVEETELTAISSRKTPKIIYNAEIVNKNKS